jgi:hypothetical protein
VQLRAHEEIRICYRCLDWLNGERTEQIQSGVRVVATDPIFGVTDTSRAADHYQQLGFATEFHDNTYAFANRDDLTIHLTQRETVSAGTVYLHVNNADQLAEDWREAGMQVEGPTDTDYGKREGSHTDPDGNLIRFGSPISS